MRSYKLDRKGFTLIELLAVIVILAVVMAVTIPTVLNAMDSARTKSLENATDAVAEWFSKNYELASLGELAGTTDIAFQNYIKTMNSNKYDYTYLNGTARVLNAAVLEAAGVTDPAAIDAANSTVYYNTTKDRICVHLVAAASGSFYVPKAGAAGNAKNSSGC